MFSKFFIKSISYPLPNFKPVRKCMQKMNQKRSCSIDRVFSLFFMSLTEWSFNKSFKNELKRNWQDWFPVCRKHISQCTSSKLEIYFDVLYTTVIATHGDRFEVCLKTFKFLALNNLFTTIFLVNSEKT